MPSTVSAAPDALTLLQPTPDGSADQLRWQYSSRSYRMLTGNWREDARERQSWWFNDLTLKFMPPPDISRNTFLQVISQTATLYDKAPTVGVEGDADLSMVVTDALWPTLQEVNFLSRGIKECLLRLDWNKGEQEMAYRVVPSHTVVITKADPDRPDQPIALEELRPRIRPSTGEAVWTWEVWDVSDPANPEFRIDLIEGDNGERIDATAEFTDGAEGYPFASPVLPYVLYHDRYSHVMWNWTRGRELVEGALTEACYWTMWGGGLRDGAHPQRVLIDGDIEGGKTAPNGNAPAVEYIEANPAQVLKVRSRGGNTKIDQWKPAMDPKSSAEAVETWAAGLAVHAGLSPSDLRRGSASASGYSIVVSRQGQRRIRERQIPAFRRSDTLMLTKAAEITNGEMNNTNLATEASAYTIAYADLGRSLEETKAELERINTLRSQGLMSTVEAIQQQRGIGREAALEVVASIRADEAALGADSRELKVGQITSAVEILQSAGSGEIPIAAVPSLLVNLIGLEQDVADSLAALLVVRPPDE